MKNLLYSKFKKKIPSRFAVALVARVSTMFDNVSPISQQVNLCTV